MNSPGTVQRKEGEVVGSQEIREEITESRECRETEVTLSGTVTQIEPL